MILVNLIDLQDVKTRTQRAATRRHRNKLRGRDEQAFLAKNNETARRWRELNPDKILYHNAKKRAAAYGLSIDELKTLLDGVAYKCEICQRDISGKTSNGKSAANIDHCHATGKTRGVLCTDCNRGIGLFEDSPERMSAAISYLRRDVL